MNTIDMILGLIFVIGFFSGFKKGFFQSLTSLLGMIVAAYAAMYFYGYVEDELLRREYFSPDLSRLASFILTFIIVYILFGILGKILTKMADFMMMGLVNKLLGGVFSVLKYAFLASLLFMFVNTTDYFSILTEEDRETSILYGPVATLAPAIMPEIQNRVKDLDLDWKNPLENDQQSEAIQDTLSFVAP